MKLVVFATLYHRRNSLHGNMVHQACFHPAIKIYIVKSQIGLYSHCPASIPSKEFLLAVLQNLWK